MTTWKMTNIQDSNSPISENFIYFHDLVMMVVYAISLIIFMSLIFNYLNKNINRFLLQGQTIEIMWTITPMFILIYLAIPSIKILYMSDELVNPMMTVKSIGHQWYWSYEYNDMKKNINFDSYMLPYSLKTFRLLDVDNHLILPIKTSIRMLITSLDVIHSWAMPSLGIKVDATPGRLNQIPLMINRPGINYGQCSEICGANHSFMPIVLESTSMNLFMKW
uniref:Cytochrome c oxidase subunit 2 n=1 Tax=Ammophila sabulosa TaxID=1088610 RepID=A0A7L7S1G6_9HYME|nr:cytochrome c oxidase subunit II [Ammophila sabulosa]